MKCINHKQDRINSQLSNKHIIANLKKYITKNIFLPRHSLKIRLIWIIIKYDDSE